jgi:D-glycero-D-manno-heptose 1,7-bisphosphate phosphatase
MRRAVFLDLNGTLVLPMLVSHPSELTPIAGVADAVAALTAAGYVCPVVTIQSRIGKGSFTLQEFSAWFATFATDLRRAGAIVVGPYVCPHRFAEACACKKPGVLLYEQAALDHGIALTHSLVIGDSAVDVEAAARFGGRGCLVRTGYGAQATEVERASAFAAHIAASLADSVTWILSRT